MTRFPFRTSSSALLAGVIVVAISGCLFSGNRSSFWDGPPLIPFGNGYNNRSMQTYQKPPNDLSSTPPEVSQPPVSKSPSGPQIPGANTAAAKLTLTVDAPSRVQQGSRVPFESVLTNTGETAAKEVVILSNYRDDFQFPKREGDFAHQTLAILQPGESRRVPLTLIAHKTGSRCVEFTVKSDGRETVWKSVCVQVEPPRFQLRAFTPPKRTTGDRIELTALLSNQTATDLKGVTVTVAFDSRILAPHEASKGVKHTDGMLTWTVNKLAASNGIPLQAEFRCLKEEARVCLRVTVTADDAPLEMQEVCFAVAAPHALFEMRMSDTADLLATGDETEVQITLGNRTSRPIAGEPLAIIVPENFRIVSTSVERNGTTLAAKFEVKESCVLFEPIAAMPVADELVYRVKLKALRPGQTAVQAELRPGKQPLQFLSEPVTVN